MVSRVLIGVVLFVGVAAAQQSTPKGPPTLTVQVVDVGWLPLPGVNVVIRERTGKGATFKGVSDADGVAHFWLGPYPFETYEIVGSAEGFKTARMKSVRLGCGGTCENQRRYIQLRLQLGGRPIVVTGSAANGPPK